jgi:hypothetical protein
LLQTRLRAKQIYITFFSQSIETPPKATQEPPRAEDPRFQVAILTELRGLLSRGVFVLASDSDLPEGTNVLGSMFHLTIKAKTRISDTKHALLFRSTYMRRKSSLYLRPQPFPIYLFA